MIINQSIVYVTRIYIPYMYIYNNFELLYESLFKTHIRSAPIESNFNRATTCRFGRGFAFPRNRLDVLPEGLELFQFPEFYLSRIYLTAVVRVILADFRAKISALQVYANDSYNIESNEFFRYETGKRSVDRQISRF